MEKEAFILAAVSGHEFARGAAYYGGDGVWTMEENARRYNTRKDMEAGIREAHKAGLPFPANSIAAFTVCTE